MAEIMSMKDCQWPDGPPCNLATDPARTGGCSSTGRRRSRYQRVPRRTTQRCRKSPCRQPSGQRIQTWGNFCRHGRLANGSEIVRAEVNIKTILASGEYMQFIL